MKTIKTKKGKTITLLNPAEKARKFADEIASKKALTNSGHMKFNKNGSFKSLDSKQLAYRAGYLNARKDSANCFKVKKNK